MDLIDPETYKITPGENVSCESLNKLYHNFAIISLSVNANKNLRRFLVLCSFLPFQVELGETDRQLLDEDVSNYKKGFTKKR